MRMEKFHQYHGSCLFLVAIFLPRDASAERGDEIACRLSVCPSVCNVQVPWSYRLEFFENNFTAE